MADRHDDVAVEDGGVDAVAAHRLQRDLGRQLRLGDGVEDAALAAHGPVLGQAAPAWRMNHTGVWVAGSPRQAARNGAAEGRLAAVVGVSVGAVIGPVTLPTQADGSEPTANVPARNGRVVRVGAR